MDASGWLSQNNDGLPCLLFPKGAVLPNLYKLPCSCGLTIPVEANQAGCQIECSCGRQLQVPALSGILKFEPMSERETLKKEKVKLPKSSPPRSIRAKQVVLVSGVVALIVTGLIFVAGIRNYPHLHDVCLIQRYYTHNDKVIGRDTLPISPRDFRLLVDDRITPPYYVVWSEDTINHLTYLDYHPIILVEMHDNFKGGLELSYNFNEKYEKLVFHYWARFVVFGVLAIVSIVVLIVGIFLPKHVEDIGERGGESWE